MAVVEPPTRISAVMLAVFRCANGVVLGLSSETALEQRFGRLAAGFRGPELTVHSKDEETVVPPHEANGSDFDDRGGFIHP